MTEIFNPRNRWFGGFYELAIQVGPSGDDTAIFNLLKSFWTLPEITGPYEENETEPSNQPLVIPNSDQRHYYGFIRLLDNHLLACGTCVVKESSEPGGSDWVLLYVPAQEVQWKLDDTDECTENIARPELTPLVEYFVKAADTAYKTTPFKLALIGFEVSGEIYAETIAAHDIGTPWMGILLPKGHPVKEETEGGILLPSRLVWYAPQTQRI